VHSGTSSLNDIYEEMNLRFKDYKQKIHKVDSQIGCLVFLNGSFYGLELVNDTDLFSELFDGIINSYLLDAIENNKDIETQFDRENLIKRIIENLSKSKYTIAEKIGMEKRETIKGNETIGEFVTFNGIPIHLAVFNKKELNN
ncbi:MAG: ARPP-1 family domain-containing protein, partial [Thermodesulfobacteriota bacterium]